MKKLLVFICMCLFIAACRNGKYIPLFPVPESVAKQSGTGHYKDGDSIARANSQRYFYISFMVSEKKSTAISYGGIWFECKGVFPAKIMIDSIIEAGLPKKRECYERFVVQSIFEFKERRDFDDFGWNYNSSPEYFNKKDCTSK